MNRVFYLAVVSIFAAGCSSASNVETNVKTVEVNTGANKSVASTTNQSIPNVETSADTNKSDSQNSMMSKPSVIDREDKNRGSKENTPIAADIGKVVSKAPDNSEITSEMTDKGQPVETRSFKNHRILTKIERIDLDNRNIKVYLKNGKIVNLPEGKVENFLTAPADDIIKAVGIN